MEIVHAFRNLLLGNAQLGSERVLLRMVVGQKLMERRIKEADGGRQAFQFTENSNEVLFLGREAVWPGPSCGRRCYAPGSSRA